MAKYEIFISYRREGGYETAKHLFDLLTRDGYHVSFDIDTLRSGDFDTSLLERIDECRDFILIVDGHAFDRTMDPNFNPNNDWLRQELAYALKKNKNIIPIFLNGANGFPQNLPDDIVGVVKKNGPEYNRYYFNDFYKVLKSRFLSSKKRNQIGIIILLFLILCSLVSICYSIPREGLASNLCLTIYTIIWVISLLALIVGLANPRLVFLKKRGYVAWYLLPLFLGMGAFGCGYDDESMSNQNTNQNYTPLLTAKQMNIYFGSPKSIMTVKSNGFTTITNLDEQGRVMSFCYNDVKIVYDWKNNDRVVLLSYSNDKFSGSTLIDIYDFSKSRNYYTVGGAVEIDIAYRDNGTISEMIVSNPESVLNTIYEYSSESEVFPYSIIQKMDDQTIKVGVTIDQIDHMGNPTKFTETCLGNTMVTNQTIEYYE